MTTGSKRKSLLPAPPTSFLSLKYHDPLPQVGFTVGSVTLWFSTTTARLTRCFGNGWQDLSVAFQCLPRSFVSFWFCCDSLDSG